MIVWKRDFLGQGPMPVTFSLCFTLHPKISH